MDRRVAAGVIVGLGGAAIAGAFLLLPKAEAVERPAVPREVDLTIYNNDFALVRERRGVQLPAGASTFPLPEVSQALDPQSVLLRWAGKPASAPEIIGHSFDLGAADTQSLLKQEVGKPVELVRYGENGREVSREQGRLLVAEGGRPAVVEIDGKLHVNPEGTLVLRQDDRTPAIPQLTVQAQSTGPQSTDLEVAYLTRGLRWDADYVATLSGAEDRLDLECYATVTNQTGIRYPTAQVTLVAGSPNRAVKPEQTLPRAQPFTANAESTAGAPVYSASRAPEAVGDLQAYPLKNAATVRNDQLNRLLMFKRDGVKIKKDYSYQAPYLDGYCSPQQARGEVTVGFSFVNTAADAVGDAMPSGALRVYDPDRGGTLRYAGAADLPDTPKGSRVAVTLGNAFDVTTAYRTVSTRRTGKRKVRKEVEVRLENARPNAVRVRVVQGLGGPWKVITASDPWTRLNSNTAQWQVQVPSGGKKLTFAVELGG